jgi:type IV pilus assembly protein PilQ
MNMKRILTCLLIVTLACSSVPSSAAQVNQGLGGVLDTRISFEVSEADIDGVLKTLAAAFDLNIVVGEGITGNVTLTLKDVRLEDALDLILEATGYYYSLRDNIILVQAPEKDLATEVILINYVQATDVKDGADALLSELGSIDVSGDGNRLIIKETPKNMGAILKEIKRQDHAPLQVLIEARIVEVEDTDLTAFGIDWNHNLSLAGSTDGKGPLTARSLQPPSTGAAVASDTTTSEPSSDFRFGLSETSTDLTGGQIRYGVTYRRLAFATKIDALIRTNRAHILASPTIAAMDGEEAKIIIGEKFPFRENTLTAVGTTETTKFVDIGTALRVVPRILNGEDIELEVHPEVSSLNASLDAGPRINTREAQTKLIVKNGQTIVIAGLISHDKTVIRQKVPFFGNIPLLGLAFRNKSTDFVKKELAVFITPYIMPQLQGKEGVDVVDEYTPRRFYNRAFRMTEEFGIESLGMSEAQRSSEAIGNFEHIARNFSGSELADDSLYQLGLLYDEKVKNPRKAAEAWLTLAADYPDSPYVTDELLARLKVLRKKAERFEKKRRKQLS